MKRSARLANYQRCRWHSWSKHSPSSQLWLKRDQMAKSPRGQQTSRLVTARQIALPSSTLSSEERQQMKAKRGSHSNNQLSSSTHTYSSIRVQRLVRSMSLSTQMRWRRPLPLTACQFRKFKPSTQLLDSNVQASTQSILTRSKKASQPQVVS